jgi:hypothetical protein
MKKLLILSALIILGTVLTISCKKESDGLGKKYYPVPTTKTLSNIDLLNKKVYVEWITSDGRSDQFYSTVSQFYYTSNGVPVAVVNGSFDNKIMSYEDEKHLNVSILFGKTKTDTSSEVFAFKPFFFGENQTWNARADAPIGVYEDFYKIVITSNCINAVSDGVDMGMRITIYKQIF